VLGFGRTEPEDGDQTCPQNVLYYISIHTMEKAQNVYKFKFNTPWSEPSRIVIYKYKLISALINVTDKLHIMERDYHVRTQACCCCCCCCCCCHCQSVWFLLLHAPSFHQDTFIAVYSHMCNIVQMIVCCNEVYVDFVTGTCVP